MKQAKHIVIAGAGFGGITCAMHLRKLLPDQHRITLITKDPTFCYSPSLPWVLVGKRHTSTITRSIDQLKKRGIEIEIAEITAIDPNNRTVHFADKASIQADYLILAMGADYALDTVPGLADAGFNVYSLDGASAFSEYRHTLTQGRIAVLIASMPFKCPAAPYEIAMLVKDDSNKRTHNGEINVSVYTPEPGPMPLAGPVVSKALREMLTAKRIDYFPEHAIQSVDSESKILHFQNQVSASYDVLLIIPPHRAPSVILDSGLAGASGWVDVDSKSLATRFKQVYAIGDVVSIPLTLGKPLPKAGVLANRQAETVANNIAYELGYQKSSLEFDGHGECFVEIGQGKAAFGKGNFYAQPTPAIKLRDAGFTWHLGKVALEKYWLYRHF